MVDYLNPVGYGYPYYGYNARQNDDFMWNATQSRVQANNTPVNPAFSGSYINNQQSTGTNLGSGNSGLGLALGAGGLTTAGMYFFGGDRVSPFQKNSFCDDIIRSVNGELKEGASEAVKSQHLRTQQNLLNELQAQKQLLAQKGKIKEIIAANPKVFGITSDDPNVIKAELNKLIKQYTNKKKALHTIESNILKQENQINKIRANFNKFFAKYWDKEAKSLVNGAPEELTNAVRTFKLKKAGKYGLIAAGIAIGLKWLFGGNS